MRKNMLLIVVWGITNVAHLGGMDNPNVIKDVLAEYADQERAYEQKETYRRALSNMTVDQEKVLSGLQALGHDIIEIVGKYDEPSIAWLQDERMERPADGPLCLARKDQKKEVWYFSGDDLYKHMVGANQQLADKEMHDTHIRTTAPRPATLMSVEDAHYRGSDSVRVVTHTRARDGVLLFREDGVASFCSSRLLGVSTPRPVQVPKGDFEDGAWMPHVVRASDVAVIARSHGARDLLLGMMSGEIKHWQLDENEKAYQEKLSVGTTQSTIRSLAVSTRGIVAATCENGTLAVFAYILGDNLVYRGGKNCLLAKSGKYACVTVDDDDVFWVTERTTSITDHSIKRFEITSPSIVPFMALLTQRSLEQENKRKEEEERKQFEQQVEQRRLEKEKRTQEEEERQATGVPQDSSENWQGYASVLSGQCAIS